MPLSQLNPEQIGGAYVRRLFRLGGQVRYAGHRLDADTVRAIPAANRRALIEQGVIDVFPVDQTAAKPERIIVPNGKRFDVVSGVRLNDVPLTREEAEALAAATN